MWVKDDELETLASEIIRLSKLVEDMRPDKKKAEMQEILQRWTEKFVERTS